MADITLTIRGEDLAAAVSKILSREPSALGGNPLAKLVLRLVAEVVRERDKPRAEVERLRSCVTSAEQAAEQARQAARLDRDALRQLLHDLAEAEDMHEFLRIKANAATVHRPAVEGDPMVPQLAAEVERLRKALEEREGDMHTRIRAGYDKTVADSWRAALAKEQAEVERLRAHLSEVANSGVELDDQRMRYVSVQIGREAWEAIRKEAANG